MKFLGSLQYISVPWEDARFIVIGRGRYTTLSVGPVHHVFWKSCSYKFVLYARPEGEVTGRDNRSQFISFLLAFLRTTDNHSIKFHVRASTCAGTNRQARIFDFRSKTYTTFLYLFLDSASDVTHPLILLRAYSRCRRGGLFLRKSVAPACTRPTDPRFSNM